MTPTTPPSSRRIATSERSPSGEPSYREPPPPEDNLPPPPADRVGEARLQSAIESLRRAAPWIGYSSFFVFSLVLFAYWTFPYDRIRDRIVAELDKAQRVPPGGARQTLSIGKLEPSWLTGAILRDVALTTTPADPTKPSSTMRADEVHVRVRLGSIFSSEKDITLSAKALGGTIEGSITHKTPSKKDGGDSKPEPKASDKTSDKDKKSGPRDDRTIKLELTDLALNEVAPLRDAIGSTVGGTLKASIDVTLGEGRVDRANGTVTAEIEGFWVNDGKTPFKIPALKQVFGSENITLPQMAMGNLPLSATIKNGVARIEKMEAKGKDVDLNVDGNITLREAIPESDLNIGLRFKFNDSYRKKGESTSGLLMLLDSEPKLRASKRPDGFYALKIVGLLGGTPQVVPSSGGAAAGGGFGGAGTLSVPPSFGGYGP